MGNELGPCELESNSARQEGARVDRSVSVTAVGGAAWTEWSAGCGTGKGRTKGFESVFGPRPND